MLHAKFYIKEYLQKRNDWVAGGDIERYIPSFTSYKPSYISRVLREMAENGEIKVKYEKAPTGRRYVLYRS